MKERRQIVEGWRQGWGRALVTLVRAEGSSYRLPGARLLLGAASSAASAGSGYAGTISGGCLEAEVVRRAEWILRGGAAVERYSMSFDDTAEIPFGLGCGGTVDLLFEPLGTPEAQALLEAMERSLGGAALSSAPGSARVIHFLPDARRGLRRLILDAAGEVVFASAGLGEEKIACARGLVPGTHEGRFVETLDPPQRLLVLGAGDDARPLVLLAAQLGWNVTVADGRSQLARAERFPEAQSVVTGAALAELAFAAEDAVVVMTHSYEQDRQWLERALPALPRYLGLLGSRQRSSLLIKEAAATLGRTVAWCCERVSAPVGLDLGGDGPEAIALATIAEAQAVTHGRPGSARRLDAQAVQRLVELGGSYPSEAQAQCALDIAG